MISSPLSIETLVRIGPVPITTPVVVTWAIMAVLGLGAWALSRRLRPRPSTLQSVLEMAVEAVDDQVRGTLQADPAPCRALIGTLFLYILVANWSSLIPGVEPPTAHLETDVALAGIVFAATIWFGIRAQGLGGWLKTFAEPSWAMIPLNLVEQVTRNVSLVLRLFGNVMSGVFVIGIVLSLAGLLVPIPLMALDLLTGAVQAYIFAVLATVFIGSATGAGGGPSPTDTPDSPQPASSQKVHAP
ncbi:F0F1 ATP synthase subunit A (plasmid) [Paroceanicella profunda]|uniref:ATP synthase subunit a n=1 Tax=Paroceanicella profunda TaxID=2579971 RepID=A0A5B8FIM9_9RHOB|nr:F0F1 ATP synthase subunit A [Paroceanicella profunda]QDL93991.1 F0F1 ATP synthase subunit A [Paroceanicella profunda]